jgi:hypothetical protein
MLREIKSTQRLVRQLLFRVQGTGTAAILEGVRDASLVDNGTGDWTLTFTKAFLRTPVISVDPIAAAGDIIVCIKAVSTTSVQINGFDGTDGTTAKDCDFHLMVSGFDTADQI